MSGSRVQRYDLRQLVQTGDLKEYLTESGYLVVDATLARTGVQEYRRPDGTVQREYRSPEEVFHPDALASFALVPLTLLHPPEDHVTPATSRLYAVGAVGETVRSAGRFVKAKVVVHDEMAIDAVAKGLRQLSCGYTCDLTGPGVSPEGETYHFAQTAIRGNHVALVPSGRAGPEARLHVDGLTLAVVDAVSYEDQPGGTGREPGADMAVKLRIDGVEHEMSETAAQAVSQALAKQEAQAATQAATQAKQVTTLTAERDTAAGRADAAEAQAKVAQASLAQAQDPARLRALVVARVGLERRAVRVLGPKAKLDALGDRAVKEAVICALDRTQTGETLKPRADAYVEGCFETLVAAFLRNDSGLARLGHTVTGDDDAPPVGDPAADTDLIDPVPTPDAEAVITNARERMLKRMQGACEPKA